MKAKDRLQGYFVAGTIGFAVGVLWMIWSVSAIYVGLIYERILIITIFSSITLLGLYEIHDALKGDWELVEKGD